MNGLKRKEFADWIREKRKNVGLTYVELSQKLNYHSTGTIVGIETGRAPLPLEKIDALAEALGISIDELLAKIEECEPELYAKYRAVEKGILKRFMGQLLGKGTSGSIGLRDLIPALFLSLSLAFCAGFQGSASSSSESLHNTSYHALYLIRTCGLSLARIVHDFFDQLVGGIGRDTMAGSPALCA